MDYWDTSALVKLYAPESDSDYFIRRIAGQAAPIMTSAIAETEVAATLLRKEFAGALPRGGSGRALDEFRADCRSGAIILIPYSTQIAFETERVARSAAEAKPPLLIRSLDLIHATSASLLRADTFVASDKRLRDLAGLLGLCLVPEATPANDEWKQLPRGDRNIP